MTTTLKILVQKYHDIFSTTVKGKSARVPPLDFTVDAAWETTANRLPSRQISPEKHLALHGMIEELLDLNVIKPSKATSWSQVHLVKNRHHPTDGGSQLIIGALIRLSLIKGGKFQICRRFYNVLGTSDLSFRHRRPYVRFFPNAHH